MNDLIDMLLLGGAWLAVVLVMAAVSGIGL